MVCKTCIPIIKYFYLSNGGEDWQAHILNEC